MMFDLMMPDLSFSNFKLLHCRIDHSVLKLFTGFAIADLEAHFCFPQKQVSMCMPMLKWLIQQWFPEKHCK